MAEGHAHAPARDRPGWVVILEQRLVEKSNRRMSAELRRWAIKALRLRDGDGCCFGPWCLYGGQLDFGTPPSELRKHLVPSIEHRLSWYRHRSHRLEHLGLAHTGCNQKAGQVQWAYIQREERLARKAPRIRIDAWPALTYADELEFD